MQERERFLRTFLITIAVTATSVVIASMSIASGRPNAWLAGAVAATLALGGLSAYWLVRVVYRNPVSMTIALVGFRASGKTVYVTVLFDMLQRQRAGRIMFAPYGAETVERVSGDLSGMSFGKWPPATPIGSVFFYTAQASVSKGLGFLRRRYKLRVADYAGEHMAELDPTSAQWLHRTSYFKTVVESEAIIMTVDCATLVAGVKSDIDDMQNAYIAALQILAEAKGATADRKLRAPVALLFLKADVLAGRMKESEAMAAMERLLEVCEGRCRYFESYFVSSVGQVQDQRRPPSEIRPHNVVEPIGWILDHLA